MDIVEKLKWWLSPEHQTSSAPIKSFGPEMKEAADEIERLRSSNVDQAAEIERLLELVRGIGANRYWEGRWRDEKAENEKLRAALKEIAENSHDVEACVYARQALRACEQSPGEAGK